MKRLLLKFFPPRSALFQAADLGCIDVVTAWLENGGDPDLTDKDGRSLLMQAARFGHLDLLRLLLKFGADPDHRDKNGITAFMSATREGNIALMKELHASGADIHAVNGDGYTALKWSVKWRQCDAMSQLLEWGAALSEENDRTGTLADVALTWKNLEILDFLREKKIGHTPGAVFPLCRQSILEDDVDQLAMLLSLAPVRDRCGIAGLTLCQIAVALNRSACLAALLEDEANPNLADRRGVYPLHMALGAKNVKMTTQLIRAGADPDRIGPDGRNAYEMARDELGCELETMVLAGTVA